MQEPTLINNERATHFFAGPLNSTQIQLLI